MKYIFRNKLLQQDGFNQVFQNELEQENIIEIPDKIWDIIESDGLLKKIDNKTEITFEKLLKEGYNEGRCYQCTTELVLLLNLYNHEAYQISGINKYFRGTKGSKTGAHYWIEVLYENQWYILDTSLLCMIKKYHTSSLGYEPEKFMSGKDLATSLYYSDYYKNLENTINKKINRR